MTIDTEQTVYVCLDITSGEIKLLTPRGLKLKVVELRVDDPDPESTDNVEAKLAEQDMDSTTIDIGRFL